MRKIWVSTVGVGAVAGAGLAQSPTSWSPASTSPPLVLPPAGPIQMPVSPAPPQRLPAAVQQPGQLPAVNPSLTPPRVQAVPPAVLPGGTSSFPTMPTAPVVAPAPSSTALKPVWKNGLFFESDDKSFSLFVGGRAQFDVAGYIAPRAVRSAVAGVEPLEDGVSFRRVRLDVGGTIYRTIDFYVQFDFVNAFVTEGGTDRANNVPAPTDLWFTFKEVPFVGNVRAGNHKPPIGFEHLTSSRFLNFMERSPGFDAFVENGNNGFEPGISVFDTYADQRGTWAAGVFKNTRSVFGWNAGRNEAKVAGRVTFLPVYLNEGQQVVHVGLGATHADADDDGVRARSRFSIRNAPGAVAPLLADTGVIDARQQQVVVPEFVIVNGPLSLQSEYYASWVQSARSAGFDRGTAYFQSAYVEAHYFLTGEHRAYDRDKGAFGRVVPLNPFSWSKECGATGPGAWQVLARYSYLDLDDRGIEGGRVHDFTLGLNWFLNPNAKVQWNYFLADRDMAGTAGDGVIHGFGTRMAWDF